MYFFFLVREMFRRNDRNSIPLLEIITQQCLETVQIMVCIFFYLFDRKARRLSFDSVHLEYSDTELHAPISRRQFLSAIS